MPCRAGSDGLSRLSNEELFSVTRLRQLRFLQIGAPPLASMWLLDNLPHLQGLALQTNVVNLLDTFGTFSAVQRLQFLGLEFRSGIEYEDDYYRVLEDGSSGRLATSADYNATPTPKVRRTLLDASLFCAQAVKLPNLLYLHVCIEDPLKLDDAVIPDWIRKQHPDLLPPWKDRLAPNLRTFYLAPRHTDHHVWPNFRARFPDSCR